MIKFNNENIISKNKIDFNTPFENEKKKQNIIGFFENYFDRFAFIKELRISMATSLLPPWGTIISAYLLVGSIN